ncbi:leucine-rich repeat-containing protein [Sesbania bispinosa]|nr:leucine-rich repeat-containing protein [Sesbania bispinosa]
MSEIVGKYQNDDSCDFIEGDEDVEESLMSRRATTITASPVDYNIKFVTVIDRSLSPIRR